jgi:hypothetical protein
MASFGCGDWELPCLSRPQPLFMQQRPIGEFLMTQKLKKLLRKQTKLITQRIAYVSRQESIPIGLSSKSQRLQILIGYCFLVYAFLDYGSILIPLQLTNPQWELSTIGALVERIWSLLLGYLLIFYRYDGSSINRVELSILRLLSWLALVFGLFYLLMLPLGTLNTFRLNEQSKLRMNFVSSQQLETLQIAKDQLVAARDPAEVTRIADALTVAGVIAPTSPEQITKEKLVSTLERLDAAIREQSSTTYARQFRSLLKTSVKWNLGALLSAIAFFNIWRLTAWSRKRLLR